MKAILNNWNVNPVEHNRQPTSAAGEFTVPGIAAWQLLEQAAAEYPHRIAWHSLEDSATYGELWRNALRMASALRAAGVEPGDRVGILLPNMPEFPLALNGIWLAGATAVILSPLSVTEEISALIERTDCLALSVPLRG